jgi:hypothetical protein
MKTKFENKDNKKKYNQRAIVEGNFGHIFNNLGFTGFQTRGTKKTPKQKEIYYHLPTMPNESTQ